MASSCLLKLSRVLLIAAIFGTLPPSAIEAKEAAAEISLFPAPGTYELPRILKAPESLVLEESSWWPHPLSSYTGGKITLLSFFYSTCRDPEGCPALWSLFESVHELVKKDARLHGKVRLVLISLDPRVDRPSNLQVFAMARRDTQLIAPWHFLTTWSEWFLGSILDGFGQAAARDLDANGNPVTTISHQVKYYLLDSSSWVREIYSSAFVSPAVIGNDIRTLLLESETRPSRDGQTQ